MVIGFLIGLVVGAIVAVAAMALAQKQAGLPWW